MGLHHLVDELYQLHADVEARQRPEADLSMFGRTEGRNKRGPNKPENVGLQRDVFWPVRASVWRVATFNSTMVQHDILWPAYVFRIRKAVS